MSKGYINFLRALLFNKIYSSQTINLISGTQKTASRYRTQGIDNGHIRKIECSKRARTTHKITLYVLTKRGFRFLLENDDTISEWLGDNAPEHLDVLSAADRQEKNRLRVARDTACLTLAQNAGAYVPVENYTTWVKAKLETDEPDDDQNVPVAYVIAASLEKSLYEELFDQSAASPTIQFHSGRCVKAMAAENNSLTDVQDFMAGRYNGVIDSKFKCVLMYAAPLFGMTWNTWATQKELSPYRIWAMKQALLTPAQHKRAGRCCALVVTNEKQFKNLFFNVDGVNQGGAEFGGDFDHIYIVPLTTEGAKHLRWLMTTDDISMNSEIISDAISSGEYRRNKSSELRPYTLLDIHSNPTALGFQLDGKAILDMKKTADAHSDIDFTILCYDWQVPYYDAVMPNNVMTEPLEME